MILKVDSTFYNKISGMIPKLHYKLRSDYMSIDGKRLYYDDIFKLICKKSGNRYSYKPSFMLDASEISENDIVLDAFPFYIVALVDLMLYHDATDTLSVDLFSYVTNVMFITDLKGKSFDEAINNLNSLTMDENINFFACMQSIRGTNLDSSLPRVRKFINLMIGGHLPPTIPYNKLHEYINYNAELNGFGYGMSAQMLGIIVSELCRDKNDLTNIIIVKKYSYHLD